ncbi:hypothetical protein N0V84_010706 [Fusarium piperis]|uniref:F-box domain-containing protein n=1 Tax=Fusarium piperis TaxID=1435070 RepID=A0A9W8TBQ8_9HYPO|nr:hypothetical protein N0V84_010706 [Fusarium piperis]
MSNVLRMRRRPTPGPGSEQDSGAIIKSGLTDKESPKLIFMALPTEIHLAISRMLIYPDALSLKHTNAHFYSLVDTGVNLKVEWLMERRSLHLECPNDRRCDLGSDLRFCRGSVPTLNANLGPALAVSYTGQERAHIAQPLAGGYLAGCK